MSLEELFNVIEKGGSGSGNFGHSGRPGKRGGSGSSYSLGTFTVEKVKPNEEISLEIFEHPEGVTSYYDVRNQEWHISNATPSFLRHGDLYQGLDEDYDYGIVRATYFPKENNLVLFDPSQYSDKPKIIEKNVDRASKNLFLSNGKKPTLAYEYA